MLKLIFALIAVAVAVPAGGLLAGVDRRLTARLQSRQGPPLLQPFYDVLKLFGKAPCVTNPWLIFSSYVCLMASAIALLMFFMQGDMLLLFFVMTVGAVFKVAGALSADSPYSNVGAQRELLEISHWLDVILLLGLCSLFWHTSITGMVVLLVLTYALEIVVDNVCARMTWGWMLKHAFGITLGLAIFNILWLYVR